MITCVKNQLRRLLAKNAFVRGVSVLMGGTASAQVLLVLAAPLLTRLYSPEDFGLLAVYASLLSLIGVISSLRYELAITLPEDDGEAANVAVLCLILVVLSTILTGVLVLLMGSAIAAALGVPKLAGYLWLLPAGVLLTGFYSVFNYWAVRTKRFTTIAGTKLRQAVATLAIQLAALKLGGIALLLGQVAGQGVGTTTLGLPAIKSAEFKQVSWAGIKKVASRYRRAPIFSTWAGLVNTAGHQLPPLIFAAFFSAGAAGLYALANRLLAMPANLTGGALAQVFLSHGVESHREGNLGLLYSKLQNTLIQIGLPPTLLIVLVGPELFAVVFGQEWREAGVFAQWLAVGAFIGFVVSPLSIIFTIMEEQRMGLMLQLILFILRLVGISIGIFLDNLLVAVALFSAGGVIGYMVYIVIGARLSGCNIHQFIKSVINGFGGGLIIIAPIAAGYYSGWQWLLVASGVISFVIYAIRCMSLIRANPT